MAGPRLISLVLPCRNQADHIVTVLGRYLDALRKLPWPCELIVVPNACRDTVAAASSLADRDTRVRVIEMAEGGWGRALRTGLAAAHGDVFAYTNTARTAPELLPVFLRRYATEGDAVVKARRRERAAPLRQLGSWLYNFEARALFGLHCDDVNGTPKVFSRRLYEALGLEETGDLFDLALLARAAARGVRIVEIETVGFQRHGGRSSTTLASAWKMYRGAVALWASERRRASA